MITHGSFTTLPGLEAPPTAFPRPPVQTRAQILPFGEITWENFERLCYRFVKASATVEYCARYGLQGEKQDGIDIFGRLANGKYACWQAKRVKTFGVAKLKAAATLFEEGSWAAKSETFVIAVQASMASAATQLEIERQVARFRRKGINFCVYDAERLTEALRAHPAIIDDFFGRAWVEALLGADCAAQLNRLDGVEFSRVRDQLSKFYTAHFHVLDPGSFGSLGDDAVHAPLTLVERFVEPDLIVRDTTSETLEGGPPDTNARDRQRIAPGGETASGASAAAAASPRPQSERRRTTISAWAGSGEGFALLGEAGLGKSTMLRVIALDLLGDQSLFPRLAERWGSHLPLHISFAAWAREVAEGKGPIGLNAMVRRSLQTYLTAGIEQLLDRAIDERRVLLLIDGLDEWSDEQAARTALTALVTTAETHRIPTIVTGRPRGLARIGTLPATWKRAEIAPLSRAQQVALAGRWFDRYLPGRPDAAPRLSDLAEIFLGELARDPGLFALAATPLLLIGLVTLRLRGKMLPRNRIEALQQLVDLLLEEHPAQRATAAGDARSRFRHADDAVLRRSAIARLAFAVREQGGGAGFPAPDAKRVLVEYLATDEGFDLERARASAAAAEILAVNAETQGMLVEKAPGEIGFAHASFEEFLSAEYLHGRPFAEVCEFVTRQAGEPRWRNVIANLLAIVSRRDEFDRLVEVIDQTGEDLLANSYRRGLLAEIAFGSSARFPAAGKRLAAQALADVELGEWMPLRRDGLGAALRAIGDPNLGAMIEAKLLRWTPLRQEYRAGLIDVLAGLERSPDIADVLWLAMHDDDRGTQKAAAIAYAEWFKGDEGHRERLFAALRQVSRPHVAVAYLECLCHGWPEDERLDSVLAEARQSFNPTLRLSAITALMNRGAAPLDAKEEALHLQSFWSGVDYADKGNAAWCLCTIWKDDPDLVGSAIQRVSGGGETLWEYDAARAFLLNSSTTNTTVQDWLLQELREKEHFTAMGSGAVWMAVGRFALANADIREAGIAHWLHEKSRLFMRELREFVAYVPDDRLKALAMDVVRGEEQFEKHWACRALLDGWTADDADVRTLFEEVRRWSGERLVNLTALLPDIETDPLACRRWILEIAKLPAARRDLIAIGLERCGCDGGDDEAVAAILASGATGFVGPPYTTLFNTFSLHPEIRKLAESLLQDADAPLAALAQMADTNSAVRAAVLAAATPLPHALRSDIADAAITGGMTSVLGDTLARYDLEKDGNLKVRLAIGYYGRLARSGDRAAALSRLKKEIISYGMDLESRRAGALAGFTILGELGTLARLEERGKPVNLSMGSFTFPIAAMGRLMCEHWADLRAAFGDDLESRCDTLGSVKLSSLLGEAAYLSDAAAAEFLTRVEEDPSGLPPSSLRTLAILRPGSSLLRERCLASFGAGQYGNEQTRKDTEVAQVLADVLPHDPPVLNALIERLTPWPTPSSVLALGIYAPGHAALRTLLDSAGDLVRSFGGWSAAAQIVAPFATPEELIRFVLALITRGGFYARFDVQSYANLAIETRLRRDDTAVDLMIREIRYGAHPSILATFPRLLAAAGKMDEALRAQITEVLTRQAREQVIPLAGYDAVSDGIRSVRHAMFDALQFGAEI